MGWLSRNWKKLGGALCGIAVVALEPSQPGISAALGAACGMLFASDYHAAETFARVGRDVIEAVRTSRKKLPPKR